MNVFLSDHPFKPADRRAIATFLIGTLVIAVFCVLQSFSDIFHGTVYFLITGLYLLWILRHHNFYLAIGVVVSAGIIVGFIFGKEHGSGPLINRVFSIVIFWMGIRFILRYHDISSAERINRNRLHALFENASEAILLVDASGTIVMGNPAAVKSFGYTREEIEGLRVEQLIPERFRKEHEKMRRGFLDTSVNRQMGGGRDLLGLRKDGTEFPVELGLSTFRENGQIFIVTFVNDVTGRKQQEAKILSQYKELRQLNMKLEDEVRLRTDELCRALDSVRKTNGNLVKQIEERLEVDEQLRKSQALYKAVSQNFQDGLVGVLNAGLEYVFLEGSERDRPLSHFRHGLPSFVVTAHGAEIRRAFTEGRITFECEVEGEYYDVVATPITESVPKTTEVLLVIRNVTKYKTYEDGLRKSLEKEKQLNVLKSRFVSNVSHEFRTPLSTILSSVFLIENDTRPDAANQKKHHIARIRRSINTLTELLDDFLSLEKLSEGKVDVHYSTFPLPVFLEDFVSEMETIKKGEQRIHVSCPAGEVCITTDKSILWNVLNNLGTNAIKYSGVDGLISLDARIEEGDLVLSVSDNGMGIPESEQKYIFDRFYRAHNAVNIQGTGLGLNLVVKYMKLLNGVIDFESEVNKGSVFTIRIPVRSPESESVVQRQSTEFA